MADGSPTGYQTLQQLEIVEFYYLYRAHVARIERINSTTRKKGNSPGQP